MKYLINNHQGFQIIHGTFEECETVRLRYLDMALMMKYRKLSYIYDNRAGAIAFRTGRDRRNEEICARKAQGFRRDLPAILKEIAYYRAAKPVEIARRAA